MKEAKCTRLYVREIRNGSAMTVCRGEQCEKRGVVKKVHVGREAELAGRVREKSTGTRLGHTGVANCKAVHRAGSPPMREEGRREAGTC